MYLNNVYKSNKIISLLILLIIWSIFIGFIFLEVTLNLSDYQWSCVFTSIMVIIFLLRYVNKINIVSLYSLFFITTILFLGGRFLSIFLGYDKAPLFEIDFFTYHKLNNYESSMLFYWLMIGLYSLEIGFYISRLMIKERSYKNIKLHNNKVILYLLLLILYIFTIQQLISNFQLVISGGYLALYANQGELTNYTYSFTAFVQILSLATLGIYLSQDNRKLRNLFIIFLILINVSSVIMGGRGGFSAFIIFLIWYFYDYGNRKANPLKVVSYGSLLLIFLSVLVKFISLRDLNTETTSVIGQILEFLYGQGITLMVFNESMGVENYPINAYFQNFIAGFSFFYSRLVEDIPFYKLSFNSYNSYSINSAEFLQGYGMGWSLFSDAYLHGLRNPILYSIFLAVFSYLLNYLQINLNKSIYSKIIAISLFIPIMTLPRAGLNNVIPIAYYVIVMYWVIRSFDKRSNY